MEQTSLNILWLLIASVLVLLLQAGFLLLETGLTRSKNMINVAMKNLVDFTVTFAVFWLFSFGLMFGDSLLGIVGQSHFVLDIGQGSAWNTTFFIFQSLFCATAVTIVSGAIAERVKFHHYIILSLIIAAFIYPVSGHWVWGSALTNSEVWLSSMGFVDFAGSTVVHSVGGWIALAALLIVGPRNGRFKNGKVNVISGSQPSLALLGVFFFVIGWIGFNGGSTLEFNSSVPGIIANTILSAVAGGISAYLFLLVLPLQQEDQLVAPINGILAGLVSITANAHVVTAVDAFIIGTIGAIIMMLANQLMLKAKLDDAIGAIPVHLAAGIWGTLCVAIFGNPELLNTGLSFFEQLKVQAIGIFVVGMWAFTTAFILFYVINKMSALRVSKKDELDGLNVSEHGAKTDLIDLLNSMHKQASSKDLTRRVPVEPFTEVGQIARQYNQVISALESAVHQTKSIVRDIHDGIITFDSNAKITSFNPGAEKIFGVSERAVLNSLFINILHPDEPMLSLLNNNKQTDSFLLLNRKRKLLGQRSNKELFFMEVTVSRNKDLHSLQFTASVRDISEKQKIEDQLFEEKERALITLASIADGVITTDHNGYIQYINNAAERITGWELSEAVGKEFNTVYHAYDENGDELLTELLTPAIEQNKTVNETEVHRVYSKFDEKFTIKHTSAPIVNSRDEIIGAVMVFHDVTSAREMQKVLSHQASHDSLTGLMNRYSFEKKLQDLINDANEQLHQHVLCYLDLDQFKIVNDTCGHLAGDELLKQVSQLISYKLRRGDTLARLGGDEFAILLLNCPIKKGLEVCEEIREEIKNFRFPWEDKQFSIGISIGIVPIDQTTRDLSHLLSMADTACYTAKDLGRNRVHTYEVNDEELQVRQGQMQWVSIIRKALDENNLHLYYQTIAPIDNPTPQTGHYEIFVRIRGDDGNMIPPGAFIPAAERYNLMQEIDIFVVRKTLDWLSQQSVITLNTIEKVSINLSGSTLGNIASLQDLKQCFREFKVNPEIICFEVTETATISNLRTATRFMDELKAIGCCFSLDDFGSGLSSFEYLKNLQVDYLKIDGVFIKDICHDSIDLAMVKAINTIGHVMGIKTIAEFVEDKDILSELTAIGVDYAQGYYIDKPQPIECLSAKRVE
ncbi:MAG: ammonium transporter [Gammaproteobacteria bacterium]|nr:ammonium transporter [Gammaproteobacteria bacterium]